MGPGSEPDVPWEDSPDAHTWPVGFAEVDYDYDLQKRPQTRQTLRWIGKPWRRIELLTHRHFYKGEQVGRGRDLSLHLGLHRFGLCVTLIFGKHDVLDYSDEEHQ
jgi:hypothetical protein